MTWMIVAFAASIGMALVTGLWLGERRARKYIENLQLYGQPDILKKAVTWHDPEPEETLDKYIDDVVGKGKALRNKEREDAAFSGDTVEKGVVEMMAFAREEGAQLTPDQAREEVVKMLNAQGGEIE